MISITIDSNRKVKFLTISSSYLVYSIVFSVNRCLLNMDVYSTNILIIYITCINIFFNRSVKLIKGPDVVGYMFDGNVSAMADGPGHQYLYPL